MIVFAYQSINQSHYFNVRSKPDK